MTAPCIVYVLFSLVLWGVPQEKAVDTAGLLDQARMAAASEDYAAAVEAYTEVIRREPHNVRALFALARLYATASDPEFYDGKQAVELALMALDDAPGDPDIMDTLAKGYFAQGKYERAAQECVHCMEINPYDPAYAVQLRKFARTWAAELDRTYPGREVEEMGRAAFYLGRALVALGKWKEALSALEKAFRIDPGDGDTALLLARVRMHLQAPAEAVRVLESLGPALEEDGELLLALAGARRAAGDLEGAEKAARRASEVAPDLPGVRSALGRIYLDQGRYAKAVVALAESLQRVEPGAPFAEDRRAEILFDLGRAFAGAGETEDGLGRVFQAVELRPDLPGGAAYLLELYAKRFGSREGVRTYFAGRVSPVPVLFREGAAAAGLTESGSPAFGDYDGDGDADLLLDGCRLFENDGKGVFHEVTREEGLPGEGGAAGIFGDYDNDGDLDIFMAVDRPGWRDRLFRNEGKGGFVEVVSAENHPSDLEPTRAALFFDANSDGFLDLYLANGGAPGEGGVCEAFEDGLFLGKGDGTFLKARVLLERRGLGPGPASAAIAGDFDNDGDADLFVTQEGEANRLLENRGGGTFEDTGGQRGVAGTNRLGAFARTVGAAFGDVDGDGDLDLFVAERTPLADLLRSDRSRLLLNGGRPAFSFGPPGEVTGIRYVPDPVQPILEDFNGDGFLDLVLLAASGPWGSRFYLGRGDGTFRDATWVSGFAVEGGGAGGAAADVDGDGDLDLFVAGRTRPFLFLNEGTGNHWVAFRLRGRGCNGTGLGARVVLDYQGRSQVREVGGQGRGPMTVHFGLGSFRGKVNVTVQWPEGRSDFYPALRTDRVHLLKEGK